MRELRQSTAQTELIGPYLDKTNGVDEETALTPATEISKDGGAFAAGPTGGTHDSEGWYPVAFTATHTDTLGSLMLKSQDAATHLAVWHEFMVVTANYYDSKYGTDVRDASVTQWLGTAVATPTVNGVPEVDVTHMEGGTQTVTDLKQFADDAYDPSTDKISGVVLVDTTTTNVDMVAEAPTTSQINTEVDTALTDIGLDHLVSASVAGADITDNSIIASLVSKEATADWDDFVNTTDSLQAIKDEIGSAVGADISADVATVKAETALILTDTGTTLDTKLNDIQGATFSTGTDSLEAIRDRGDSAWITATSVTISAGGIVTSSFATGAIDAAALATDAVNEIADGLLDRANAIETGLTLRQAQRLIASATAGKLSGAATTTVVIREAVNDSKARITATVDADGNRSAITWDVT